MPIDQKKTVKELAPSSATLHNDQWDALRHAYLHGLASKYAGYSVSKNMGDLHEDWSGNPPSEKTMDLNNNQIGRDTYTSLLTQNLDGYFYNVGLLISLINLKNNGGLWKLQNGVLTPTP